jgi:hypothetical protein
MNEGEEDVDQPNVYYADEASKCGSDSFYDVTLWAPVFRIYKYDTAVSL